MVVHLKKKKKKSIVKNTTNFTIGLQIGMSSITKKNLNYLYVTYFVQEINLTICQNYKL